MTFSLSERITKMDRKEKYLTRQLSQNKSEYQLRNSHRKKEMPEMTKNQIMNIDYDIIKKFI